MNNWAMVLILLFLSLTICGQNKNESELQIQKAINDLGSDNYEIRLKAKKILEEAGLKALPYLRKVANSDELEIKEYATNKLSNVFSYPTEEYKPEKMLGVEIKVKTYESYFVEYYSLIKNLLLDVYKKTAIKDAPYEANVKNLISILNIFKSTSLHNH